jgi:MFS family permease
MYSTGLLNSYGTFQTYYKETLMPSMSESNISWIGSVQAFLLYSLGVIFGSIFDKYGPRVLTIPGTIIFDIALMTSSLCNKYWQLMLTQGILFGIGNSML